jgi:Flp pilus assembly protein TadG
MSIASLHSFLRRSNGTVTIEFVLMIPFLFGGFVFSYEFGRALWAYDVLTRDVRASVRYLSRTQLSETTKATNVAQRGVADTSVQKHFPWNETCSTAPSIAFDTTTRTFSTPNYNQNGAVIQVTATVPMQLSFMDFLGFSNCVIVLSVQGQARHIGA